MYNSTSDLIKRSGKKGVDRPHFLKELVDEFYSSTNTERRKQVVANLANFSYDPLNFAWLREAKVPSLFLEVVSAEERIPELTSFALAGICNISIDNTTTKGLVGEGLLKIIVIHLHSSHEKLLLSALGIALNLLQQGYGCQLGEVKSAIDLLRTCDNKRVNNLAAIFLEDYAHYLGVN